MGIEDKIKEEYEKLNKELALPLKEIKIDVAAKTAFIDMKTHDVNINPEFVQKLVDKGMSETDAIRGIEAHEIGHYLHHPFDLRYYLIESAVVQNVEAGSILQNLYDDIADNLSMVNVRGFNEIADIYKAMDDTDQPIMNIINNLYKYHTGKEFGAKEMVDKEREALEELKKINFGEKRPKSLRTNLGYFCSILKEFLSKDTENQQFGPGGPPSVDNYSDEEIEKELKKLLKERNINDKEFKNLHEKYVSNGEGDSKRADIQIYLNKASKYPITIEGVPLSTENSAPMTLRKWSVSDPLTSINPFASLGQLCTPGLTKRWEGGTYRTYGERRELPDAVILLDSSGSMADPTKSTSVAVVAGFTAAEQYFRNKAKVAVVNFSNDTVRTDLTSDTYEVYNMLILYQNGGTQLDVNVVKEIKSPNPKDYIMITDTAISNIDQTLDYLSNKASNGDRAFVFSIGNDIESLEDYVKYPNIQFFPVNNPKDLPKTIIKSTSRNGN